MFTLWYTILSWKQYRDVIMGKLSIKGTPGEGSKTQFANSTPHQNKLPDSSSKIPVIKPTSPVPSVTTKPPTTPPLRPEPPKSMPQIQKISPIPSSIKKRQPSPHPIANEEEYDVLEDEEEESEEDEDEEDDEEEEEDSEDENSILDFSQINLKNKWNENKKLTPVQNSVNDFLTQEITSSKNNIGLKTRTK